MKITAVYYCEDSGPYNMITLNVCDMEDERFTDDNNFKPILWNIFEETRKAENYPKPSSDVVFLYTEQFRSSTIAAQMLNSKDID